MALLDQVLSHAQGFRVVLDPSRGEQGVLRHVRVVDQFGDVLDIGHTKARKRLFDLRDAASLHGGEDRLHKLGLLRRDSLWVHCSRVGRRQWVLFCWNMLGLDND